MFKYEMHLHSIEGSACGKSHVENLVWAYHQAGYSGFVLTNHFVTGNTSVPRELDWNTRMEMYYNAYVTAKAVGKELDFDVLFGIEHQYGGGKEFLTYGIDLEFLQAHPKLAYVGPERYAELVHEAGGVLVHAHPHRSRDYIVPNKKPRYDLCDGIEVYNACDETISNDKAMEDARMLNLFMTSGGDIHSDSDARIGLAGMVFKHRIRTNQDLLDAFANRTGKLLINGKLENE